MRKGIWVSILALILFLSAVSSMLKTRPAESADRGPAYLLLGPMITSGFTCSSPIINLASSPNFGVSLTAGGAFYHCLSGALYTSLSSTDGSVVANSSGQSLGKISNGSSGVGFKRFYSGGGSSLVVGDFGTIAAGCGSTASISAVSGTDAAGSFTLASSGTGQTANGCSFVFTFHDGTWTSPPGTVQTTISGTLPAAPLPCAQIAKSATTVTFALVGTPVAASSYSCNFLIIG